MTKLEVFIKDVNCISCEKAIDSRFAKLGIKSITSFIEEKVIVEYDENKWSQEDILNNIKVLGYKPSLKYSNAKSKEDIVEIMQLTISLVFTGLFFYGMFGAYNYYQLALQNGWIQLFMATYVQLFVAKKIYKSAFRQLKNKKYGVDVLIVFSTTIAYLYSVGLLFIYGPYLFSFDKTFFFDVSVEVITFMLLGKAIESVVKRKATSKLKESAQEQVKKITLLNGEVKLSNQLVIGDEFLIQLGQRIFADCEIIEGESTIDESSLTGESIPVIKKVGDTILAGTINTSAPIKVRVLKESQNSMIEQLQKSIKLLQNNKSKVTKIADKISNIFVPIVFYITIATFIGWMLLAKAPFEKALYHTIAVAVVACPCAIGLAAPMSIVTGSSVALKNNILYNKPDVFEKFKNINVVAFDKTGTVTQGELNIDNMVGDKSLIEEFISLEIISMHPIAKGFMKYADENNIKKDLEFSNYKETIGKGVSGTYNNSEFRIGSYDFVIQNASISQELEAEYNKSLSEGSVTILGAKDNEIVLIISLKDKIKETSKQAISDLNQQGIKTIMITGDNPTTAELVAKEVGITQFFANAKPLDKPKIVKELQDAGNVVIFAGDGVNDGAAITQADLGIVMGSGSDMPKSVSDITLLDSDLSSIAKALVISNSTLKSIKSNLWFAFIWNTTMIPLAAFGILQPWLAAIIMSSQSLIIIGKSQLLWLINFDNKQINK